MNVSLGQKMEDKNIRSKERKPLFALALSLFLTGLGQLYNGKPKKGILLFFISLVFPLLLFQLSVVGPGRMPIALLLLSFLSDLGIYVWAAMDAWKQAKRVEKGYMLKAYNKLSIYVLLIIIANFLAYGLIMNLRKGYSFVLPYRMSTGSMMPTILAGDLILTDRRIDHAAENHGLKRGELVVFKYPKNKEKHFIKRVIGLPGDEVEIIGMDLYVNGEKRTGGEVPSLPERREEKFKEGTVAFSEEGDSGTYNVIYFEGTARKNLKVTVPEGFCFVLGDSRDNSADSRHWGMVPLDDVVARARQVYFSVNPDGGIRWKRIGKLLENTKAIRSRSLE